MDELIKGYGMQTIEEKAQDGNLPEVLTIRELLKLLAQNNQQKQEQFKGVLKQAIGSKELKIYGDNNFTHVHEPHGLVMVGYEDSTSKRVRIHKDDFKAWWIKMEQWPVDGSLANWWTDEQASSNELINVKDVSDSQADTAINERELTIWLRETWLKEDRPEGTAFFNKLKNYVDKDNGPIIEHFSTGKNGAGIRWNTGNATNTMSKKAIQNRVSLLKNELNKKCCQQ